MQYYKPSYFDEFKCVAGNCPDTCCAGWQIMIDEESLEKYGEVKGSFGSRLRNSIDWMEECFYQYNKRCAFLNEENLCDLYMELGADALCDTCRLYPRHVEEYEGVREWSLSLSCPIAARMLLTWQGEVSLLETESLDEEDLDDFEDFDSMLYMQLVEARRLCFEKLWEEEFRAEPFMEMCLRMAKEMQCSVEKGEYFCLEEIISDYRMKNWKEGDKRISFEKRREVYEKIKGLERLRAEWDMVLSEMYEYLYKDGREAYESECLEFSHSFLNNTKQAKELENVTKQLLFFFIYTYFCGAVYDDWIYSKMSLCVESVCFLRDLFVARWIRNEKMLTMEDYIELSYRYAREIEHSDLNLNELEDYFMENNVDDQ